MEDVLNRTQKTWSVGIFKLIKLISHYSCQTILSSIELYVSVCVFICVCVWNKYVLIKIVCLHKYDQDFNSCKIHAF